MRKCWIEQQIFFVDFVEFDFNYGGCRCERFEKYKSVSAISRLLLDKISRLRGWDKLGLSVVSRLILDKISWRRGCVKGTVSSIKINT